MSISSAREHFNGDMVGPKKVISRAAPAARIFRRKVSAIAEW
jgi:hypothetical protein